MTRIMVRRKGIAVVQRGSVTGVCSFCLMVVLVCRSCCTSFCVCASRLLIILVMIFMSCGFLGLSVSSCLGLVLCWGSVFFWRVISAMVFMCCSSVWSMLGLLFL